MRHGVWLLALLVGVAQAAPLRSTLEDQAALAVTVYNGDLALVKDTRRLALPAGEQTLELRDVSAQIRPETALLRVADGKPIRLLEQNFDFDLLTPAKLLEKYIGREVRVLRTHPTTGADSVETATVLAAGEGVVLKIGDRIETGVPGRLVFDAVPDNLRDRPTLAVTLDSAGAGRRALELSYLTGGLTWQADYVAELDDDERSLALSGWVTLTNRSGTAYRDARLQLVAGDVHRVQPALHRELMMAQATAKADAGGMQQEALLDYHLYTLGRPTTLADQQTKQVALLNAPGVRVQKEYRLAGTGYYYTRQAGEIGRSLKVAVLLKLRNAKADGLGLPLPAGVVRVYQRDSAGGTQFVGEDRIDHTPENESAELTLGQAFDVTARKTQTDFRVLSTGKDERRQYESAYRIEIKNAKKAAVTVTVLEPIAGDWRMIDSSLAHEKVAAHTARWRVTVPAGGSQTLTYRVRVRP
ncbi:DUF4139 domain-containing protein [Immundisolibacter sp.]|uniref:DUF4139 domain-containing protein n=1 Tax=Immundisolibacter sp. TaxID=1934948 RepID=UPI003F845C7F